MPGKGMQLGPLKFLLLPLPVFSLFWGLHWESFQLFINNGDLKPTCVDKKIFYPSPVGTAVYYRKGEQFQAGRREIPVL
jgi:hypothetical protein